MVSNCDSSCIHHADCFKTLRCGAPPEACRTCYQNEQGGNEAENCLHTGDDHVFQPNQAVIRKHFNNRADSSCPKCQMAITGTCENGVNVGATRSVASLRRQGVPRLTFVENEVNCFAQSFWSAETWRRYIETYGDPNGATRRHQQDESSDDDEPSLLDAQHGDGAELAFLVGGQRGLDSFIIRRAARFPRRGAGAAAEARAAPARAAPARAARAAEESAAEDDDSLDDIIGRHEEDDQEVTRRHSLVPDFDTDDPYTFTPTNSEIENALGHSELSRRNLQQGPFNRGSAGRAGATAAAV